MWKCFIKLVQQKISLELFTLKKYQLKPKVDQILLILSFDKLNQINPIL